MLFGAHVFWCAQVCAGAGDVCVLVGREGRSGDPEIENLNLPLVIYEDV